MSMTNRLRSCSRRVTPLLAMLAFVVSASGARAAPQTVRNDSVVVVVSAASTVTEISRLQLFDLYMGRSTRFPNGSPAVPIDLRSGSPGRTVFSDIYLGRSEAQMKAHWSKIVFTGRGRPPAEVASGEELRDLLARDPKAIGYLDRRLVDARLRIVSVR
jgi:hypothetical protein